MTPTPAGLKGGVIIHPCPSTSRIETRTAMRIATHGLCVCRCILYYSFHLTTAYWCHPFHPLYYSDTPRSSVSPPWEVPNAAAQGRLQDVKKYLTSTLNHSRDLSPHATQKSRASPGEREFTFTSDCFSDFEFQQ